MKWTKDKLELFFAMKEEGCSIEEICNALGCERQAVYDKTKSLIKMNGGRIPRYNRKSNDESNDKENKAMSKYPEKTAKADAVTVWRMFDEGKSRKEIAETLGVSVQTICNRITAGRPKAVQDTERKAGNEDVTETSAEKSVGDDVLGVPTFEANTVGAIHETPKTDHNDNVEGDTDMNTFLGSGRSSGDECADEEIGNGGISGLFNNTKGARAHEAYMATSEENSGVAADAAKTDLIDLAFKARYMAHDAGFEPDHLMIDTSEVRDEIIVSGKGSDGKVYEIQFSVTDPMYFSR